VHAAPFVFLVSDDVGVDGLTPLDFCFFISFLHSGAASGGLIALVHAVSLILLPVNNPL
jgi:hypothetical protein